MTRFSYKARDSQGQLVSGVVQAATLQDAGRLLRSEGKFIVKLAPTSARRSSAADAASARSIRARPRDVITFANQISVMVETGVPLSEALDCIAQQTTDPRFKQVLADVTAHVQAGGELSAALRRHPRAFPSVMTSLVRASEASGTMGRMLDRIAQYLAQEDQTARKVRAAMTYPCIMLLAAVSVTVFLIAFVLPRFTEIYASRGAALPWPTRALMTLSEQVTQHGYTILAVLVAAMTVFMVLRRTALGRQAIDYLKLHTPVVGPLFRKLYLTRGCRTMGTLITAGVPMLDIIAIVKQVTANAYFHQLWDKVDARLRQGAQLSEALFDSPLIPPPVAQMIFSGEKAGRLALVMDRIARFTEEEFDQQVRQTTQLIEPAMVAIMGALIGFVAIALLLPIFNVGRVVSGS